MKLTTVILIVTLLQVSAASLAQRVTYKNKQATLEQVFKEIRKQTGYNVLIAADNLKDDATQVVDFKNASLEEVLKKVLENKPLTYTIEDKSILIKEKKSSLLDKIGAALAAPVTVTGKVTDTTGTPLPGATVAVKGKSILVITGSDGSFNINAQPGDHLLISFIGFAQQEVSVTENLPYQNIILHASYSKLNEVAVVSTGYQTLPKERATGSFVQIDNQLLNRRTSTDVLSKLEGIVPGLLFNRNTVNGAAGGIDMSIRGTNTLFANNQPLVVIDNFPYDGDFNNINPNDIESITVLKDAAAASIWGVRSGNGVIVITTKKGKKNQKLTAEVNANVTIGNKPDLFYSPNFLPSNDFINIEQSLFAKGFYDADLSSTSKTPVSPVVQILANQRAGTISASDATNEINALRNIDVRDQLSQIFYQKSINQQYNVNLKGGSANADYFFSLGNDQDRSYFTRNNNGRITINSLLNFYPVKNLQLSAGLNYIQSNYQNDNNVSSITTGTNGTIYPYAQFADAAGNSLAIVKDYAQTYINTAGGGKFLDWNYRPLDELNNANNTTKSIDNRINLGAQYDFLRHFSVGLKYQYEQASANTQNDYNQASYFARNLINRFTQVGSTGTLTYPIPVGGILQQSGGELTSQRGRAQLNYNNTWRSDNEVSAIAGAEISEAINKNNANTVYGYNDQTLTNAVTIDYNSSFAINPSGTSRIPNTVGFSKTTDHYLSYFGNAAYSYKGRYTVSLSGRIDKSNLFGVETNQKAVPLYSTGAAWDLSKEPFYQVTWLPYLKLRATYGYTGNINKSATAVATISQTSNSPYSGLTNSVVANPGNPDLRWEKTNMINLAIDFGLKSNIISGSFEYYFKKGTDIFGNSPVAPSLGLPNNSFFGNTADIKGNGFDLVINSKNISIKNFSWTTNLMVSHVLDIVTKYDVTLPAGQYTGLANASTIYPLTGKPLYALYSYQWGGLTSTAGDPQGYLNGVLSTDYANIIAKTAISDLVYNGPSRPTTFGSFRNTFMYGSFSLSANIIYKFNYYFRRTSFISLGLPYNGSTDYYKRWQKPGDELTTNVPSLQYPPYTTSRDAFYQNSSILVDKGDHIRLQDISLSYDFAKAKRKKLPFTNLQIYGYVNNVGILWRANKDHLDPDLSSNTSAAAYPLPRTFAIGFKAGL